MEQATGEVEKIFWGGNGWGNNSAPPLAPCTLGIPRGAARRLTKQTNTFTAEVNAPRAGTTAQDLHRVLMGGNRMLHNTVRGGNVMGGATGTAVAPTERPPRKWY